MDGSTFAGGTGGFAAILGFFRPAPQAVFPPLPRATNNRAADAAMIYR